MTTPGKVWVTTDHTDGRQECVDLSDYYRFDHDALPHVYYLHKLNGTWIAETRPERSMPGFRAVGAIPTYYTILPEMVASQFVVCGPLRIPEELKPHIADPVVHLKWLGELAGDMGAWRAEIKKARPPKAPPMPDMIETQVPVTCSQAQLAKFLKRKQRGGLVETLLGTGEVARAKKSGGKWQIWLRDPVQHQGMLEKYRAGHL